MERTKIYCGACDIGHDHIATKWRHLNQIDTCTQYWDLIEMRRTNCFGETRLVLHVPSSSWAGKRFYYYYYWYYHYSSYNYFYIYHCCYYYYYHYSVLNNSAHLREQSWHCQIKDSSLQWRLLEKETPDHWGLPECQTDGTENGLLSVCFRLVSTILLQMCAIENRDDRDRMHGMPVTGCCAFVLVCQRRSVANVCRRQLRQPCMAYPWQGPICLPSWLYQTAWPQSWWHAAQCPLWLLQEQLEIWQSHAAWLQCPWLSVRCLRRRPPTRQPPTQSTTQIVINNDNV